MASVEYAPLDPTVREDPYPVYAALRREAPVYRVPGLGLFAISRYDDVADILRRPDLFSSSPIRAAVHRPGDFRAEDEEAEHFEPQTLIGSDPPVHTRLRKIANRGFTPKRIVGLEPRVREMAEALVDGFAARGQCDFIADFAAPLPVLVIAELLGVDPERHRDFKRWSDAMVRAAFEQVDDEEAGYITRCRQELSDYFEATLEARRREPRNDVISDLVRTESEEEGFDDHEVESLIGTLLVAGNITTTHLLGNAMLALLAHPGQLAKVRARPALLAPMVEEVLRYDGPVHLLPRAATEDVEIADTKVPKGSGLALLFASANRDETRFPEPDRFDVTRDTSGHLAFGLGVHFCLGAPLARLEARVAFEVLLPRLHHLELREEKIRWAESLVFRGPTRMRIAFEATR